MKILIVGALDSNIPLLESIRAKHSDINLMLSLGDLGLYSKTSPIKYFLNSKFRANAENCIGFNHENFSFKTMLYSIHGCTDDLFLPNNEIKLQNFTRFTHNILDLVSSDISLNKSKMIKIGLCGGYLNEKNFRLNNSKRSKMSREKQSNALCKNDFKIFKNQDMDYFFSHESPLGFPKPNFGSKSILEILQNTTKCKMAFYSHYREFNDSVLKNKNNEDIRVIGLGPAINNYLILDSFNNNIKIYSLE